MSFSFFLILLSFNDLREKRDGERRGATMGYISHNHTHKTTTFLGVEGGGVEERSGTENQRRFRLRRHHHRSREIQYFGGTWARQDIQLLLFFFFLVIIFLLVSIFLKEKEKKKILAIGRARNILMCQV
jgi:hypothetical protein